jgi:hypothetical protein
VGLTEDWAGLLHEQAGAFARVALTTIKREFPSGVYHTMKAPGDFPYRPRARTPAFYGCYDWHSSVEMHWALVRLLRVVPGAVPGDEIRAALSAHFERVALAAEQEFITGPDGSFERPYGWGWLLTLAQETHSWDDPHGRKWAAALDPLAATLADQLTQWLAAAAYPVRHGVHSNTAFGLSRMLPYAAGRAGAGEPALLEVITRRALEAIRTRFPVPGPHRGRADGPATAARRVLRLAEHVPARHRQPRAAHPVHPGRRHRLQRRPGRPPARAQCQPRVVLAAAGLQPARR